MSSSPVASSPEEAGRGAEEGQGEQGIEAGSFPRFTVSLDNYAGPFDALLSMIARRQLEVTEVALGAVTGEFLAFVRTLDLKDDMEQASAFVDVASVLVEAKSAALLPDTSSGMPDEQNLEALRERDLLFARLLQYRAFKEAGADFRMRMEDNAGRYAHPGTVGPDVSAMLPELVWTLTPDQLARIAAAAIVNAPASEVSVRQLHVPLVSLREQSLLVRGRLLAAPGHEATFDRLCADATRRVEVVARFLALLAFFKQGLVRFRQAGPYAVLHLRWVGDADPAEAGAGIELSEEDFA